MKIHAVLFDVYGTLLELHQPTHPYRQLMRMARSVPTVFAREVMCHSLSLAQTVQQFALQLLPAELETLERQLTEELAAARLYPEVLNVLETIRRRGYRLGLCSNLAAPYMVPAQRLLGARVECAIWSCKVGLMKPSPLIYAHAAESLGVQANSMLMVGDCYRADVEGPRRAGCQALHLDRRTNGGDLRTLLDLLPRLPPLPGAADGVQE